MKSTVRYHSRLRSVSFAVLLAFPVMTTSAIDGVPNARVAHFSGDRAAAISYTFDDNLRDQFTAAVPMLNEVGFKGTFFVIPGKTAETPEQGEQKEKDMNVHNNWGGISWPELKEMANQGHEIASHTWSHQNMPKLSAEELDAELSKACEAIKTHIGKPPLTLAFPYNQATPEVQAAALKYHVAYRAFQIGTGGKSTVASLNAWADKLVVEKKWGIVMTHAITHGYAALTDPEILHDHFKYVKSRQQDMWVDTFANVVRYEKERDDAKLEVTEKSGGVSCVVSSSLDPQIFNVPLTLVIDASGATSAHAKRAGQELPVRVGNGSIYVGAAPGSQPITITWE